MDEVKDIIITGNSPSDAVEVQSGSMYKLNLDMAKSIADELMKVVAFKEKQNQPIVKMISGKQYPMAPCWQIVGAQLQVYPHVEWTTPENPDDIAAAFAAGTLTVKCRQILKTFSGVEVGAGEAICSQSELRWDKDSQTYVPRWTDAYQILSMCQTRALGKAYRNSFGWVVQLAGMEATPAEEMDGVVTSSEGSGPTKASHSEAERFPILSRPRMTTIMQTSSADISEEELRAFVWSVAATITDGDIPAAINLVDSWGRFKGDKGVVPGPMPWKKKKDGSMMLKGKWLHGVVNKAKQALAESGL